MPQDPAAAAMETPTAALYVPAAFAEDRPEVLGGLIQAHPLALLISSGSDPEAGPWATPVPMHLEGTAAAGGGVLRAHLARANPHLQALDGATVLVVFQGPAQYVTPAWYATKREHGRVVPTWNYAIVQVRGRARVQDDAVWLRDQVTRLTNQMEQPRAQPWAVTDAPAPFLEAQLRGIVGIEIPIAHIVGKWKVSQNRPAVDRAGVIDGLLAEGGSQATAMAALVAGAMEA